MKTLKKIVIKVGTNVLTRNDGKTDLTNISHIIDQIALLKQNNIEVILISSGAVGAGKTLLPNLNNLSKVVRRQVLSAVGQVRLMEIYRSFLNNHNLNCAQVLATKEDFRDRQHYLNMKNCFQALQRADILPIVNENDVIAIDELMFTDNDELAGLVAAMTGAETLFILTNVDGIFTGHPDNPESQLIPEIRPDDASIQEFIAPRKSSFGRGGMQTKLRIAQKAAQVGITTYIANGKKPGVLVDLLNGKKTGTKVIAKENISNVKKWMAFNTPKQQGKVYINEGAEKALCNENTINSLLPIGIDKIEGNFQKGDLLEIISAQGITIGLGLAMYDSELAASYKGQANKKPIIHYDHLFIGKMRE